MDETAFFPFQFPKYIYVPANQKRGKGSGNDTKNKVPVTTMRTDRSYYSLNGRAHG